MIEKEGEECGNRMRGFGRKENEKKRKEISMTKKKSITQTKKSTKKKKIKKKKKMAPTNLSERLKAFADRFAALGRPSQGPGGGYTGLSDGGAGGLGAPLVGGGGGSSGGGVGVGGGEGRYYQQQQQQQPSRYNPPQAATGAPQQYHQHPHHGSVDASGVGDAGAGAAVNLPTQVKG